FGVRASGRTQGFEAGECRLKKSPAGRRGFFMNTEFVESLEFSDRKTRKPHNPSPLPGFP
ncbi:MAG TPA: hypothetical protein PK793_08365, partial [Syntrophales bacterium]|nr:hypothetical protein [Syntrophales bacterium]